ncbi:MAG: hypothetical protein QM652_07255 [Legionella sp.]|uniref:hypothetical protein n=1 Tax=Legionella sp. TaxID=459 RepID=UPI0039E31AB2
MPKQYKSEHEIEFDNAIGHYTHKPFNHPNNRWICHCCNMTYRVTYRNRHVESQHSEEKKIYLSERLSGKNVEICRKNLLNKKNPLDNSIETQEKNLKNSSIKKHDLQKNDDSSITYKKRTVSSNNNDLNKKNSTTASDIATQKIFSHHSSIVFSYSSSDSSSDSSDYSDSSSDSSDSSSEYSRSSSARSRPIKSKYRYSSAARCRSTLFIKEKNTTVSSTLNNPCVKQEEQFGL